MARNKIKSATDQRKFTMVYNDFLDSDLLNYYEKMIFIAIKRFADNETMKAFPSVAKLHNMTGISTSQIKRTIASLEEKGVLKVEHRTSKEKGHQSNLYILYDFRELWNAGSSDEVVAAIEEYEDNRLIQSLETKGYTVIKSKEPVSEPTKAHAQALELNQFDIVNTTINSEQSQEYETYSMQLIKKLYDYDVLQSDNPELASQVDAVMELIYNVLNTKKLTVRIGGENKPKEVVISKLLKLTYEDIRYAITKYMEKNKKIKNPNAYMLTILFGAKEQWELEIANSLNLY